MLPFDRGLAALRAAGEPTRLRLLLLCSRAEHSVGELARVLGQSEPRVSRHLKGLCEAGLLERVRRGQWVCYRKAGGAAAELLAPVLARLDADDAVIARDRMRAQRQDSPVERIPARSRIGLVVARSLREMSGASSVHRALLVEPTHPEFIDLARDRARHVTIVSGNARAREVLREHAGTNDDVTCVARTKGLERLRFDLVLLDLLRPGLQVSALGDALRDVAPLLSPHALVWLCLPYDALEHVRGNVVEHPIAALRRALGDSGFRVDGLKPIEAEGDHVLLALARPAQSAAGVA